MRNRVCIVVIGILSLFVLIPLQDAHAVTDAQPKTVKGKLRTSDGVTPVTNASIEITCGSSASVSVTTSPEAGNFSATFPNGSCGMDMVFRLKYQTHDQTIGTASKNKNNDVGIVVLQDVPVSVPEFDILSGAMAFLTTAGSYMALKKKK